MTVHEWYRTDDTYARDIASAQKSVLSLLVGRAIADGFIGIDTIVDDVLGSGWTPHGQTSDITVRHLLTMTSGLDDSLALVAAPGTGVAVQRRVRPAVRGPRASRRAARSTTSPTSGCSIRQEPSGAVFYERRTDEFAPIGMRATVKDLVAIGQMVLDRSQPGLPEQLARRVVRAEPAVQRARTGICGG